MILTVCAFVLLGIASPLIVSAIPSPDFLGPLISWVILMVGFVSVGFGIMVAWFRKAARWLTPHDRRVAWIGISVLFGLVLIVILLVGWFRSQRVPPQPFPPIVQDPPTTTSTHVGSTSTTILIPPSQGGDLISSRVSSSTILVPTSLLKEVVAEPGWSDQIFLIDIREQEEREVGLVDATTTWIRYGDLIHGSIDQVPTDRDVLIICWTSRRGSETVEWMRAHGLTRTFAVKGGLQGVLEDDKHGWIPDGLPWQGRTNWSTAFQAWEYAKRATLDNAKKIYDDETSIVIDVREEERFDTRHIAAAIPLPLRTASSQQVSSTLADIPMKTTPIIIYADDYVNTFYAKVLGLRLQRLGFISAVVLLDPNHEWMTRGYPTER